MTVVVVFVASVALSQAQLPAPLVLPTLAPPVPNMALVEARFEQMQERIHQLTQRVTTINEGISEILDMSRNTALGVANADRDIQNVDGTAQANLLLVQQLASESENATRVVEHAAAEMQAMKHFMSVVELHARSMGGSSAEVARKLADIEADVAEYLPGEGGVTGRIATEETTVTGYQEQADDGMDRMVARSLRKNFRRSTGRISDLTVEVQAGPTDSGPAPAPAAALPR